MKRLSLLMFILAGLTAGLSAQSKKRIAILNFDYATVQSNVVRHFWDQPGHR